MEYKDIERAFYTARMNAALYDNKAHVFMSRRVLGTLLGAPMWLRDSVVRDKYTGAYQFMGVPITIAATNDEDYLKVYYEAPAPGLATAGTEAGGGDDGSGVPPARAPSEPHHNECTGRVQSVLPSVQGRGRGEEGARSPNFRVYSAYRYVDPANRPGDCTDQ